MRNYRKILVRLIERHCAVTGLSESYLAIKIAGNGNFFKNLRAGGGCSVDKYLSVREWFRKNKPVAKKARNQKYGGVKPRKTKSLVEVSAQNVNGDAGRDTAA